MTSSQAEHRPRVVLGVGGGIAAYKACEVLRRLTESGHAVRVVPTRAALNFVGAATFEALSGQPVATGVFTDVPEVPHVRIGQTADLVVVAPATADLMAKAAAGMADDLLTGTLLTARCPVLMVPAMHTEMWEHPATQANVATLRSRGVTVVEPASGRLTGKDTGKGRLPEPSEIVALATLLLERPDALPRDMTGLRVAVSAGGTREPLDPVRYLTNRSSGKQGYALARVAAQRGAEVTLVSTVTGGALADPAGVRVVRSAPPSSCTPRCSTPPPRPTWWSWPPRSPTSGPPRSWITKLRKRKVPSRHRLNSAETLTSWWSWSRDDGRVNWSSGSPRRLEIQAAMCWTTRG